MLRDCESNIRNIVVGTTVNNPVRRIALVITEIGLTVTGIRLVDLVEAVVIKFVVRHADEVPFENGHEWAVVVVDVVRVVMAVRPSTMSPCPFRRRVVGRSIDVDIRRSRLEIGRSSACLAVAQQGWQMGPDERHSGFVGLDSGGKVWAV